MNYSKAISWIDDCRIPFTNEKEKDEVCKSDRTKKLYNDRWLGIFDFKRSGGDPLGRFPANLLCSDDMLNDGTITGGEDYIITSKNNDIINWGFNNTTNRKVKQDKGSNSRYYDIDKWFNKLLDELQ